MSAPPRRQRHPARPLALRGLDATTRMPDDGLSETQAANVLRRAALLHARHEHARGTRLSLDEVKRAAEAAGIDGQFVEQAALGAGDDVPTSAPFLGIQTGARHTRIVPGRVSDGEWGKMVATLRRQIGGTGEVETIGGVGTWRRSPYHVILEPEGENTRVTASGAWRGDTTGAIALPIVMLLMALMFVAASLAKGKPDVMIIAAVFGAMSVAAGLFTWPRLWPKGPRIEGKLDRAMDALQGIAGADERAAKPSRARRPLRARGLWRSRRH